MKLLLKGGVASVAMITMLMFDTAASAQTQDALPAAQDGTEAQATEADDNQLGDIVVTAQRRTEVSQKVPISMTVLSGETVAQNLRTSDQVAQMVPNIQLGAPIGFGTPRTGIRGVSQSDFNPNATTSNMLYFDDVALNAPVSQGAPIWDLDRVEVLRGPQGTLFGRNAIGGAIRYISAMPTDQAEGYIDIGVGGHGLKEIRAAYGGPITDTLLARISYTGQQYKGDFYNTVYNERQGQQNYQGVRGILQWSPVPEFKATARAQYFEGDQDVHSWKVTPGRTTSPGNFGPLANGWTSVGEIQAFYGFQNLGYSSNYRITENDGSPREHIEHLPLSLNLDYDFGPVTLTSVTGYLRVDSSLMIDNDASPAPFLNEWTRSRDRQFSQELRLASNGNGDFKWIAGAYYMREKIGVNVDFDATAWRGNTVGLFPASPTVGYGRSTRNLLETYAGFLHTTYNITPDLMLTAAARYTWEEKDVSYVFRTQYNFPSSAPRTSFEWNDFVRAVRSGNKGIVLAQANPLTYAASKSWENLTWKLGLDYQLNQRAMVYGSVSKGFKGGSFPPTNNLIDGVTLPDGSALSVNPETVMAYEAGFKGDLIPSKLRLNTSVFYYDYRNYQTNQLVPQLAVQILSNLPKAELYGAEAELNVIPVRNLTLSLGAGVVHTRVTDSLDPSLIGNELPLAEDFNWNAMVRYDLDTPIGTFSPQFNVKHTGNYFTTKENNVPLGDFTIANANIGWESPGGKYYGQLWVTNLFDTIRTIALDDPDEFWGGNNANINQHRRYGIKFGVRF